MNDEGVKGQIKSSFVRKFLTLCSWRPRKVLTFVEPLKLIFHGKMPFRIESPTMSVDVSPMLGGGCRYSGHWPELGRSLAGANKKI